MQKSSVHIIQTDLTPTSVTKELGGTGRNMFQGNTWGKANTSSGKHLLRVHFKNYCRRKDQTWLSHRSPSWTLDSMQGVPGHILGYYSLGVTDLNSATSGSKLPCTSIQATSWSSFSSAVWRNRKQPNLSNQIGCAFKSHCVRVLTYLEFKFASLQNRYITSDSHGLAWGFRWWSTERVCVHTAEGSISVSFLLFAQREHKLPGIAFYLV